jgi:hypothetical protein
MAPDAVSMNARHRTKSFRHKAGIALVVLLLTVSAGRLARVQILRGAARAWIVSDSIVPADAVVVLGGGLETRPFAAADLYKKGMARQILISAVRPSPAEKLEIVPSHVDLNRAVLLTVAITR